MFLGWRTMQQFKDIDQRILMKHLEQAYCEDLEKKYTDKGYQVYRKYKISDNVYADFAAKKGNEVILYKIKTGKIDPSRKERLLAIKEYADQHSENVKFKMILLNPPESTSVEFDKLYQVIFDDLNINGIPDDLDVLSVHTHLEEVTHIEIENMEIDGNRIHVQGNGTIEVSLQYGSDSESSEDDDYFDDFPFHFDMILDNNFNLKSSSYDFDTSSFYR
jgi:hypothetical protein